MRSTTYKLAELLVLFILVPVSFALPYHFYIKAIIALIGFIYVVFVILKLERLKFEVNKIINWKNFWKNTVLRFIVIAIVTNIYVLIEAPNNLYVVVKNKPFLFVIILFVYSVLSVYPQELIYRTFFFSQYAQFFKSKKLLIFINAILFSLAHLFFANTLVMILTFLGGLLFASTFLKTKSTFLVSIEHAIYGCWLFTVGMGEMLGFPS